MTALPAEGNDCQAGLDVTAMKRGETAAFESAVRLLTPRLLGVARRIIGEAGAEDAVQEAWLVAFRRIGEFEERARLETWLTRIVVNQAISARRRHTRESARAADEPDPRRTGSMNTAIGATTRRSPAAMHRTTCSRRRPSATAWTTESKRCPNSSGESSCCGNSNSGMRNRCVTNSASARPMSECCCIEDA
ncbi:MAG: RNA polymerase sigma factor [Gammaproteobacteria bacterium]|nr:RNA polymerase sigma factor [Gammaproteobacteria bacterium]